MNEVKKTKIRNIITLSSSVILLITSIIHINLLDLNNKEAYTTGILLIIEIISFIISGIMIFFVGFFTIITYIFNREWKKLGLSLIVIIISLIIYIIAINIDYPTLIYGT